MALRSGSRIWQSAPDGKLHDMLDIDGLLAKVEEDVVTGTGSDQEEVFRAQDTAIH